MSSTRSKLILAAIAICAIAGFLWSRHTSSTDSNATTTEETAAEAGTSTNAEDPNAPTKVPTPSAEAAIGIGTGAPAAGADVSFKSALQQCWGAFAPGPVSESVDVVGLLHSIDQEEAALSQTIFENYHISTNEGERRVQVLYQDNQPSQLRFFGVDDEDLPVPVSPEDSNKRPIDQALQDFLRKGTQTFHQTRREVNLKNGLTAEIETVNDNPSELQLHGLPGGTFVCSKENCRCLSAAPTGGDLNRGVPVEETDDSP